MRENAQDRDAHGTIPRGERHGRAKLSDAQAAQLRALQGTCTQTEAARQFGVTQSMVSLIWSGRNRAQDAACPPGMFADAAAAREYLEARRWPNGVCCPTCGISEKIVKRGGKRAGYYRCSQCAAEFTVRSGTVLERSHVPLATWLNACWTPRPKDGSIVEFARRLGVNRRTAERVDRALAPVARKSIATRIRWLVSARGGAFSGGN